MVVSRSGRVIADSAGGRGAGQQLPVATGGRDRAPRRRLSGDAAQPDVGNGAARHCRSGGPRRPTVGAVRITQSVEAVNSAVRRAIFGLGLLSIIVLGLGLIAGALIAQQIARPIRRLGIAAGQVASGDLDARAPIEGSTEQRSLARSFNEMTERVSRLLRSQRDFVADASHELRTPLTGLRLQLEEVRDVTPDSDPRAQRLDAGMSEVDRLSQMVDELLVLSRAGEHEQPGTKVDLAEAADGRVERWQKAAADAGVDLGRAGRARAPSTVWCTAADLDRALDALIENAIRYCPPGSGSRSPPAATHRDPRPRAWPRARARRKRSSSGFTAGAPADRACTGTGLGTADRPRARGAMGRRREHHQPGRARGSGRDRLVAGRVS